MKTGFIGLGRLGRAIAGRLAQCGHSLVVWNRTADKAQGLPCSVADSPAEVAAQADIVFMCLFDSHAVREVLTGEQGLLAGPVSGRIIIDLTTNHFAETAAFHAICREAGAFYLESPVLGSVMPAAQGNLTVLVSGDRSAYEQAGPLLADIGSKIFFLEKPGLAIKVKLLNNMALGSFMAAIAEAVAFAEHLGMSRKDFVEILAIGGGSSLVLNAKKTKLIEEDFSPQFTNALIYKDLYCLMDLAYSEKQPLFTGAMAREFFARANAEGLGQEDFSAIYKICRRDK